MNLKIKIYPKIIKKNAMSEIINQTPFIIIMKIYCTSKQNFHKF
jgi:hypothetical protein